MSRSAQYLTEVVKYSANNYKPLPVVLERGEGAWVWDVDGKKYLDCLSAYSAVNQGHCHPAIVKAAQEQAARLTLTSRAFHNDQMGPFLHQLCELAGFAKALPMNSGAEAVETAIKAIRKWGYKVKKIPEGKAEIVVSAGNFHGRTTTIISFSTEAQYKDGFGPFTPGFKIIPFGDAAALEKAITPNTCAFLTEPLQGEAGVIVAPDGWLRRIREITRKHNVLWVDDEIQTGLGRTGKMFAWQWEGARPDALIVGKAVAGGMYPVSAFLADENVMSVFNPGDHGSTFGGNPLGAGIGRAALRVLVEEKLADRAQELGTWFMDELRKIDSSSVVEVRGKGLLIGVEIKVDAGTARPFCEALAERGILCKETHDQVVRFAPPLTVSKADLQWALPRIAEVLAMSFAPAMAAPV
ncbi:MAG TPA: ornithine--oxo-acid transaminase [Gemmatimonadales bacterium]|nr:ornithine--oxo-acid transaminase [Gemmatimonadales bacterium]